MISRVVAKIIIVILSIYCVSVFVAYFYNVSIIFPFFISDGHHVPEHRLHAIRLTLFTTFVYFSIRYLFIGSVKLYPIQVMGIILLNLTIVGTLVSYFKGVDPTEYLILIFYLFASIILYYAGKPEVVKRIFKRKWIRQFWYMVISMLMSGWMGKRMVKEHTLYEKDGNIESKYVNGKQVEQ